MVEVIRYQTGMPASSHWHEHLNAIARRLCAAEDGLKAAQDLLLERARENAELLRERDEALAQAAEFRGFLDGLKEHFCSWTCPSTWRTIDGQPHASRCKEFRALLERPPAAAIELQRARRAVVEAAKRSREAERKLLAEQDDTGNAAKEELLEAEFEVSIYALKAAVDALGKLEGRP